MFRSDPNKMKYNTPRRVSKRFSSRPTNAHYKANRTDEKLIAEVKATKLYLEKHYEEYGRWLKTIKEKHKKDLNFICTNQGSRYNGGTEIHISRWFDNVFYTIQPGNRKTWFGVKIPALVARFDLPSIIVHETHHCLTDTFHNNPDDGATMRPSGGSRGYGRAVASPNEMRTMRATNRFRDKFDLPRRNEFAHIATRGGDIMSENVPVIKHRFDPYFQKLNYRSKDPYRPIIKLSEIEQMMYDSGFFGARKNPKW